MPSKKNSPPKNRADARKTQKHPKSKKNTPKKHKTHPNSCQQQRTPRRRPAGVPHAIRAGAAPVPCRCRIGAAPVPHRCRRRSAANPYGYLQTTARKKAEGCFFPVFFDVFVLLGVFLCFLGGVFARRRRAVHLPGRSARDPNCAPNFLRTCAALVPHLFRPHLCRTCAALVPHLFRTCVALVPHLCRTCAALWADLRRGALFQKDGGKHPPKKKIALTRGKKRPSSKK